jgi:integrase
MDKRIRAAAAFPKDDVRYWRTRVHLPRYTMAGTSKTSRHYALRISWQGKRLNWSLGTGNKEVAAQKAKDVYLSLVRHGYEETAKEFRPPKSASPGDTPVTLGQFLERVSAINTFKLRTFVHYRRCLRRLYAEVTKLEHMKSKFSGRADHREWTDKVDSIPLDTLTPAKVREWQVNALKRIGPVAVNATIECSRAFFSPDRVKYLGFPATNPFVGVKMAKQPSSRYRSQTNLEKLTRDALAELPQEPLKFFLLAALAGLRRGEIDLLEWEAFNWDKGLVTVARTQWFHPKSEDSVREVELDDEAVAVFRGFYAKANGPFVIEAKRAPRRDAPPSWYRSRDVINELLSWLKAKGISKKPLHTLRKEFGSVVCDLHGIYAASLALGHANIGITARYYLDKKGKTTVGLGHLLAKPQTVVRMTPVPEEPSPAVANRDGE